MSLTIKNNKKILSDFVSKVCKNRDESHGHQHMKQVYINSINIFNKENYDELTKSEVNELKDLVTIVSWLHDVNDHKYDYDGTLTKKVDMFLEKEFPKEKDLVKEIITRISYSKEVKNGRGDWNRVLGKVGLMARNIVSDADKMEAVGKIGLERCLEYTKSKHKNISKKDLLKEVEKHVDEKLIKLKDNFICTVTGKKLILPLHNEMIHELKLMKQLL